MIKAIYIDVDNTLLSFDGYVKFALKSGFEKFGLGEYTEKTFDDFEEVNQTFWRALERGEITFEDIKKNRFNAVFKSMNIDFDGEVFEAYFRDCLNESAIPMEHAYEMLDYLKGKYILCVASNGPFDQQVNRLKIGKMDEYFDYYFVSEDIGYSKPSKGYYDEALNRLNENRNRKIKNDEIMFIGDSLTSDMAGAIGAGQHTCFYNFKNIEVNNDNIEHVITSLIEVKDIL